MKIVKGKAGYIKSQKKKRMIFTVLLFALSAAVFFTGYLTTHTRNNLLTIVAVLGCLPAARQAVSWIVLLPYQTIEKEKEQKLEEAAPLLVKAYDMVLTSREKVMPVDVMVISNHLVCGYVSRTKTDPSYTEAYIRRTLKENLYEKITVKIFTDYKTFLGRAEGMNNIAAVEKKDNHRLEESIKDIILTLAM